MMSSAYNWIPTIGRFFVSMFHSQNALIQRAIRSARNAMALLALVTGPLTSATEEPGVEGFSPVQVSLQAKQSRFVPGETITVALHQKIRSGFHTYWRNPGTVGLATQIEWDLPPGFQAGPIQWPTPTPCSMASYTVWGYREEAVLLIDITTPKSPPRSRSAPLKAKVSWMCCGRQCHPGFQEFALDLQAGDQEQIHPAWSERFQEARAQQAQALPGWRIQCERSGDVYQLSITPVDTDQTVIPRELQFYGYRRQVSSAEPQIGKQTVAGYQLTLQHEAFSGEDFPTLTGLITASPPWDPSQPETPLAIHTPIRQRTATAKTTD